MQNQFEVVVLLISRLIYKKLDYIFYLVFFGECIEYFNGFLIQQFIKLNEELTNSDYGQVYRDSFGYL